MAKFNTNTVMDCCKKMNAARRNILNEITSMTNDYSSISTENWDGNSRQYFHEKVFGIDGESGLIGLMGNKPQGTCKALNDLLFELANYVCTVANEDGKNSSNYTPINTTMFVDESVTLVPLKTFLNYSEITQNNIAVFTAFLDGLEKKCVQSCDSIIGYVEDFNNALTICITEGIKDETTDALRTVVDLLEYRVNDFKTQINSLLHNHTELANITSRAEEIATTNNANIANILAKLDFTYPEN